MSTRTVHADTSFQKYVEHGAYHWREVGPGLLTHNAFTAERYRTVIDRAELRDGHRVLDYGCGDGALLGVLQRRVGRRRVELHGFDPNELAVQLARETLEERGVAAAVHASLDSVPDGFFDCVLCTEVIEHAARPEALLCEIARVLRPGGRLVLTTPIRLGEVPDDPNHVREWFPGEFARLFPRERWDVRAHDALVPAAAVEAYFWRPPVFARMPIFRLLCNVLSVHFDVNALSWLRLRPHLFMMQIVVADKTVVPVPGRA
ncbi:MAG TPA: class I SAM-dependent methyltransferase [Vicinamibacterales bacterium]|nr:class I SAM-dependent methyltransferase [Vicinamibacterales bacterium]